MEKAQRLSGHFLKSESDFADKASMTSALRKFVNRAPRYILQASDNQVMRFASDKGAEGVFKTRLINISETGAAFLVDRSMSPQIGEVIKVELPIPGIEQIAWFGKVVRLETYESDSWWSDPDPFADDEKMVVAIHFFELPEGHRKTIQQGIQDQFLKTLKERRQRQQLFLKNMILDNGLKLLGYALLAIASFGLLYFLSLPSTNYDSQRGSPWGQRFKFFQFENR